MATMARASSGLAYPERFFAAASYAGFDGSLNSDNKDIGTRFSNDVALILYALYQQATIGPCNVPKPSSWSPVEQSKWKSWQQLGNMVSTEAMRLFVKILEHNSNVEPIIENGNSFSETKTISSENGSLMETKDKDIVSEGLGLVIIYDQWISPPITGQRPKARYEHGAAVIQDKMYICGGNHNGRYLSDLHVLDLRGWTWSKFDAKVGPKSMESPSSVKIAPCAGHSLIPWENKLLSIAGHTKDPSETIQVKAFDLQTGTWSMLKTNGKAPVSRGGQSVTLVGTTLVIFGGQDSKRTLLNDLHILDLETLTWDEIDAVGVPPSPRSDHAAAVHAERYLLIFGGGSHATCFNDLHVLDLQAMEWSRPTQQGEIPTPRAGHAGVTVGENWFIVGGGDNKSGASETVVLNMSTLVWSVVTSVQGRVPLASEGLSLVVGSFNGEDILVSFGGYNGHYNNEVNVLKPSHKSTLQSKIMEASIPDSVSAVHNATNPTRDLESEFEVGQEGKIREIVMDNVDSELMKSKGEETSEHIIATLKVEKEGLESSLNKEKLQSLRLKQEVAEAETRNTDLYKELQSVRGQLAAEQSRCFKLEVEVAELRQKLQTMETLQKELELLQRQKAASEQAALNAKQRQGSGGVWGWLAGSPPQNSDDA
ncbi:acyl-CoA-binding domain-containing protein 4-like isoform X2 [Durio zibethinus]|uniref:Acyl-CoA-binding domain-containing protein 4-like isoform X2 n=1 Tax=Durio zibethinus TaxID=66656 RepID=A0A6P5WUS9_DURZI|nr:acyl-CoA-binding domain-containing protein 4-like isoform X2 [Durio zibethinus]